MDEMYGMGRLAQATRKREFDDGLVDLPYGLAFLIVALAG